MVGSAQPIVQTDGHSCAIHVVDIFLQDDQGEFRGKILDRKSFKSHIYEHFGDEPLSSAVPEHMEFGGGRGDPQGGESE